MLSLASVLSVFASDVSVGVLFVEAAYVLACGAEDFDTAFLVLFLTVAFLTTFTVILAVPAFTTLTTPFAETVATFLLEVNYFTFPLTPVSFNVFVLPTWIVALARFKPFFTFFLTDFFVLV